MKLTVEIIMDNAVFEDEPYTEIERVLLTVKGKVSRQLDRAEGCICDAEEIDDKLLDINGNTVGFVRLER